MSHILYWVVLTILHSFPLFSVVNNPLPHKTIQFWFSVFPRLLLKFNQSDKTEGAITIIACTSHCTFSKQPSFVRSLPVLSGFYENRNVPCSSSCYWDEVSQKARLLFLHPHSVLLVSSFLPLTGAPSKESSEKMLESTIFKLII